VLFGQTNPGGHLPVTFPTSLSEVPASTTAQFPGNGTEVLYSEGVNVGYRWYDANHLAPMFPFGFGLSYTKFAYSGLRLSRATVTGTQDVRVSATVTNIGSRTGSDVAQLYVGDPASTGEPPRQLEGFQRVNLAPGQSARVSFVITPQSTSWWSDTANGWTQTADLYHVYVGDSSALANLPLRNAFRMTSTPGARQVVVTAPSVMRAGKASVVRVTLTAGGSQTLHGVQLALQLPEGWTVTLAGPAVFGTVRPGNAVAATFRVTPPSYSPDVSQVVHATATMGNTQREAGVSVSVQS
jgi:beta-glucosidase